MPPPSPWLPRSEPADDTLGTREAPHGYRPWPNSGRDEGAGDKRAILRRPRTVDGFLDKIRRKKAIVGVVGLGYVGLPR